MSDGLFGPQSMMWRIHRETAALSAGQSALLLQIAHPLVGFAVAAHSDFPADAWRRLWRTVHTGLTLVFGSEREARAAAARINELHARVHGTLPRAIGRFPAGTRYDATDPALLLWVHATVVASTLRAYETLVCPLDNDDRERYYRDSLTIASLFGVRDAPSGWSDFDSYFRSVLPDLAVGPEQRALARAIVRPPPRWVPAPAWLPAELVTTGLLPAEARSVIGLPFGPARRRGFRLATRVARAVVPHLPARIRFVPHAHARRRANSGR